MYSRQALAKAIADATAVYNRRSRWLAVFSVIGGVGQLWLHTILEERFDRDRSQPIELTMFVIYIAIVVPMLVWLVRGSTIASPRCHECRATLTKMSGRIALATGKCDQCGAQVME